MHFKIFSAYIMSTITIIFHNCCLPDICNCQCSYLSTIAMNCAVPLASSNPGWCSSFANSRTLLTELLNVWAANRTFITCSRGFPLCRFCALVRYCEDLTCRLYSTWAFESLLAAQSPSLSYSSWSKTMCFHWMVCKWKERAVRAPWSYWLLQAFCTEYENCGKKHFVQ